MDADQRRGREEIAVPHDKPQSQTRTHGVADEVQGPACETGQGFGQAIDFVFEAHSGRRHVRMVTEDGRAAGVNLGRQRGKHSAPGLGAAGEAVEADDIDLAGNWTQPPSPATRAASMRAHTRRFSSLAPWGGTMASTTLTPGCSKPAAKASSSWPGSSTR